MCSSIFVLDKVFTLSFLVIGALKRCRKEEEKEFFMGKKGRL